MSAVLVLRPEPEARDTARAVEALGRRAVISPLLAIERMEATVPRGADALVVSSPRAVRHAPATLLAVPAFVVGERTAALWRERGGRVENVAPDGASLAPLIGASAPARLVHPCGEEIAFDFARALPDRRVERLVVYRARPLPLNEAARAALREGTPAALLTSPRIARLLAQETRAVRALALSPAVAEAWGGEAEVAAQPTMTALLALVKAKP